MVTYEDLVPCDVYGAELAAKLTAVGWLGADPIAPGDISQNFFDKLRAIVEESTPLVASSGVHACEQCQFDPFTATGEVLVPHDSTLFVSPTMILHYVATHRYRPPEPFVEAVLACPSPRTMDYKKRFLAAGGGAVRKALRHG